jgi:hypothetical protein
MDDHLFLQSAAARFDSGSAELERIISACAHGTIWQTRQNTFGF